MAAEEKNNRDLIVIGCGMLAGLLVSVAVNLLSDEYSVVQFVTPESASLVEPVTMLYILGIFVGIYCLLSERCRNSRKFKKTIPFIAGFLITMGLSMVGTVL